MSSVSPQGPSLAQVLFDMELYAQACIRAKNAGASIHGTSTERIEWSQEKIPDKTGKIVKQPAKVEWKRAGDHGWELQRAADRYCFAWPRIQLQITPNQMEWGLLLYDFATARIKAFDWEADGNLSRLVELIEGFRRGRPIAAADASLPTPPAPLPTHSDGSAHPATAKTDQPQGASGGINIVPGGFSWNGIEHVLTGKEQTILKLFLGKKGTTLTQAEIQTHAYENNAVGPEAIKRHVSRLRQKLISAFSCGDFDPLELVGKATPDQGWKLRLPPIVTKS